MTTTTMTKPPANGRTRTKPDVQLEPGERAEPVSHETAPAKAEPTAAAPLSQLIPLSEIHASDYNPRADFNPYELQQLADSIKARGVLQPILVRSSTNGYEIIAGERRYRASQMLGLATIPAIVRNDDDKDARVIALIENLVRRDISAIEEARGYRALRELGHTQDQIAGLVNRSRSAVANAERLLSLPDDVLALVEQGKLSTSHGIAIARFSAWPAVASRIGARATGQDVRSKDLEGGLPFAHNLTYEGLVKSLRSADVAFDVSLCQQCPFGALIAGKTEYGGTFEYCANPSHFEELQAAGVAARKQAVIDAKEQAVAAARAANDKQTAAAKRSQATEPSETTPAARIEQAATGAVDVPSTSAPKLSSLPYGSYTVLSKDRPTGCSDDCVCFAQAIDDNPHGKRALTNICTKPRRYHNLVSADATAAMAAKRTGQIECLDRALAVLDSDFAAGNLDRIIVVLARAAVQGSYRPVSEAVKGTGLSEAALKKLNGHFTEVDDLEVVAGESTHSLALAAARSVLFESLQRVDPSMPNGSRPTLWEVAQWLDTKSSPSERAPEPEAVQPKAATAQAEIAPSDEPYTDPRIEAEKVAGEFREGDEVSFSFLAAWISGVVVHPSEFGKVSVRTENGSVIDVDPDRVRHRTVEASSADPASSVSAPDPALIDEALIDILASDANFGYAVEDGLPESQAEFEKLIADALGGETGFDWDLRSDTHHTEIPACVRGLPEPALWVGMERAEGHPHLRGFRLIERARRLFAGKAMEVTRNGA